MSRQRLTSSQEAKITEDKSGNEREAVVSPVSQRQAVRRVCSEALYVDRLKRVESYRSERVTFL